MERPVLDNCPHCGSANIGILYGADAHQSKDYFPNFEGSVRCLRCGIGTRKVKRVEIAVAKWNRRDKASCELERRTMKYACWMYGCHACKHAKDEEELEGCDKGGCKTCQQKCPCRKCVDGSNWEWEGVPENEAKKRGCGMPEQQNAGDLPPGRPAAGGQRPCAV